MKTTIIKCDACNKVLHDNYIELGSNDGESLFYKNRTEGKIDGVLRELGNHCNLHFCCEDHFVKYFFDFNKLIKDRLKPENL